MSPHYCPPPRGVIKPSLWAFTDLKHLLIIKKYHKAICMHGAQAERLKIRNTSKQKGGNHRQSCLAARAGSLFLSADMERRFSDLLLSRCRTDVLPQRWCDLFCSIIWDARILVQGSVLYLKVQNCRSSKIQVCVRLLSSQKSVLG